MQRHVRRDDTKLPLQSNSRLVRSIRHHVIVNTNLCSAYVFAPVEQAIAECKQTLQLDPHFLLAYRWAYSNREAAFSLTNVGTDLALLRSDLRFSAMMQKMNLAR